MGSSVNEVFEEAFLVTGPLVLWTEDWVVTVIELPFGTPEDSDAQTYVCCCHSPNLFYMTKERSRTYNKTLVERHRGGRKEVTRYPEYPLD